MMNRQVLIGISAGNSPTYDWGEGRLKLDRDGQSRQYSEAVALAGGLPLILPLLRSPLNKTDGNFSSCGPDNLFDNARVYLERLDGLLLAGGGDLAPTAESVDPNSFREVDRSRDIWESALLGAALAADKPVLGICRGLQLINAALGGSLWEDLAEQRPGPVDHEQQLPRARASHEVLLEPDTRLARALGFSQFMVNSGHHQGIKDLARPLTVSARAQDGLIEAVEHSQAAFVIGVQWHPEGRPADLHSRALFEAFIQAAEERAPVR